MSFRRLFVALVCLLCWAGVALGASDAPDDSQVRITYYMDPNVCRGWFCYEDPLPILEPKADSEAVPKGGPERPVFSGQIDWEAVWSMHPDDMRALINQALAYAQERPQDEERMLTYLKLQGVAMQRAKSFQEAWASVLLKYPVLDTTVQRAPTLAATTSEVVAEREDRAHAIEAMRNDMGIIYFYSPACRYCEQQSVILASFREKWSWRNIKSINVQTSPEAARTYGVQSVPDIWVAGNIRGETVQRRLKAGLVEFSDLERGLLKAWSLWHREESYERPTMVHQLQNFDDFLRLDGSGGKLQ